MIATVQKRTIFDALIIEPVELIISQPHQALISGASVFLVAAEAGILIDWPYNVLLAIGAEWAYLKGLSSGQSVKTGWATALNWSAVTLVVLYGSLWGMRKFGVPLPNEGYQAITTGQIIGAVVLTLIHIICIGAVTICSAMVHAAALAQERAQREHDEAEAWAARRQKQQRDEEYERERQQAADERAREKQARLDAIEADAAVAQAGLTIEWRRRKSELELKEAEQSSRMQMQNARQKMRGNAHPVRANADGQKCPKCSTELDRARWLAARRWGYCSACKEAS